MHSSNFTWVHVLDDLKGDTGGRGMCFWMYVLTRSRTWVVAATTRRLGHLTMWALIYIVSMWHAPQPGRPCTRSRGGNKAGEGSQAPRIGTGQVRIRAGWASLFAQDQSWTSKDRARNPSLLRIPTQGGCVPDSRVNACLRQQP